MGMAVGIEAHGPAGAASDAFDWLRWVDATFSTYLPGSEISRLDRGQLALDDAHPLVREVLERCEQLRFVTGGFFDARATGRLDPSGLVKGWAIDRAGSILEHAGVRRFCVNAGGDILVRSGGAAPWRVGIQHPRVRDRVACVVELADGAVATSGAYERGAHVIDPHVGRAPRGVASVTVVHAELGTADAYATAAFAMGRSGPEWTASLAGVESMTILSEGRVLSTSGFLARCPGGSVQASLAA
jgi:FAD:protein FMN transferase